jgi:hypothetical protein
MRYTDVQAARVFLERSPYVSWAKQLPAFRHPAFTGVVHPDLPIWAGEPNPPPEPAPGSHASLPRIARLAKTETEALPEFHVQTISGARCGSIKDVKERIAAASDAGASAILMVTGDSGPTRSPAEERDNRAVRLRQIVKGESLFLQVFPYGQLE